MARGRASNGGKKSAKNSGGSASASQSDQDGDALMSDGERQIMAEASRSRERERADVASMTRVSHLKKSTLGMFLHSVEIPVSSKSTTAKNGNSRQKTPEPHGRRISTLVVTPERRKTQPRRSLGGGQQSTLTAWAGSSRQLAAQEIAQQRSASRNSGRPAAKKYKQEESSDSDLSIAVPVSASKRKKGGRKVVNSDDESEFEPEPVVISDNELESAVSEENESEVQTQDEEFTEEDDAKPKKIKVFKKTGDEKATKPINCGIPVKDSGLTGADLPPISDPTDMFDDLVSRIPALAEVGRYLKGRKLKVGTMCSGTESPLLALSMISRSMKKLYGYGIEIDHLFSCEIEPYKQAYIERNFRPPILFRDITELGGEYATTAYGAKVKVPGGIELLIAGTSCVDFSNLNNKKQELDGEGESAQTFLGMLRYVNKHRPPIVILENVSSGPWDQMQEKLEGINYSAAYQRFDTKHYYIPHTRVRGYMIAIDKEQSTVPGKWMHLTKQLARPASSTLDAFLLPSDDPRIHKGRLALLKLDVGNAPRSAIDWTRCESRHLKARVDEKLGNRRPLTLWQQQGACTVPDFAWGDWVSKQVERVMDLMDISTLRAAKKGVDPSAKTQVWNLSQNVDRTTASSKPGISPCLTPTMIPYITNRGGPMIGLEALSMQGLPIDELLLTRESQDQLADLAGNAMSTTVVGTCTIAALVLGMKYLKRGEDVMEVDEDEVSDIKNEITGEEKLSWSELNMTAADIDVKILLEKAHHSARLCACEGRTDMSKYPLQICLDCGFSSCKNCGVRPEHNYRDLTEKEVKARVSPIEFEEQVKGRIPMRLKLQGVSSSYLEKQRKNLDGNIEDKLWKSWIECVENCVNSEFRFHNLKRQQTWSVFYDSPHGRLELLLDPKKPEWRLFAKAGAREPSGSKIRRILAQPVARQTVRNTLMESHWEFCLPLQVKIPLKIEGTGSLVSSWEANLGLEEPQYADKKVWDQIKISYDEQYRKFLDLDIGGVYTWHSKCGAPNSSLHRKVDSKDAEPLYFFLDPGTCSGPEEDYFVFATNNRRYVFGENRPIQARVDPKFRQFSARSVETKAFVDGSWVPMDGVGLAHPESDTGTFGMPKKNLKIVASHQTCKAAQAILVCKVSLDKQAEAVWPENKTVEVDEIKERTVYSALAWLTEPVRLFKDLEEWQIAPLHDTENCPRCAPPPPTIKWIKKSNRFIAVEDSLQAGPYEQALKKRPAPIVTHISMDNSKIGILKIGLNPVTLMHRALANLPPSTLAGEVTLSWRLITGYTVPPSLDFPAFTIPDNRKDPMHAQPPNFIVPLRDEQRRSLYWMVRQESEEAEPFYEEEVAEAVMGHLSWRVEGKAERPLYTKGGVLADDVGYGKTAVTVALIDVNRKKKLKEDVLPGLISIKATLIVVPAHLCKQWPSEINKFTGRTFKIITITSQTALNALTVSEVMKADIIVVAASIFHSDTYLKYLSQFSATRPCPTQQGRQFLHWALDAYGKVRERSLELQEEGAAQVLQTIKGYREQLQKELEKAAETAQSKRLKGAAYQDAQKKKTAAAESTGKKRKRAADDDEDEDEEMASEEWSGDNDSDDKKPKKGKGKGKADSSAVPKVDKVEDVWNLSKGAVQRDFTQMKCPPLGMFHWNRLVIDEYTYDTKIKTKIALEGIQATNKWILSGTPPLEDFSDVQSIASFLNVHLGIDDEGGIKQNGRKKLDANRTDAEKFQAMSETRTPDWALRRHLHAQKFLDQFMRKNVPLIDEIPFKVFKSITPLPPAEKAVYLELEHHLQALDMVARRKGKKNTDSDRDRRLNRSLDKSNSGQEALVKRSSYFDLGKPDKKGLYYPKLACDRIVETRERQLEQCAYEIFCALQKQQQALLDLGKDAKREEFFKNYCALVKNHGIGDAEASVMMAGLIDDAVKNPRRARTPPLEPELDSEEEEAAAKSTKRAATAKAKAAAAEVDSDGNDKKKKKGKEEKLPVDEKLWDIREKTHGIKRLDKELVGRTRSLRYFKLVRDLQDHLAADSKSKNSTVYSCPKCDKKLKPADVALLSSCGHHGCFDCLSASADTEHCLVPGCDCPARHESITRALSLITGDSSINSPTRYRYGAKMGVLIRLIKEEIPEDEKVLVFVQFPDLMERIRRALEQEKVHVLDITGSAHSRSTKLQQFQEGGKDTRVLLLNVGDESASGANLTVANHAIFVAPLYTESPQEFLATETQAIGRVVRYGQKKVVKIYRLFAKDTIDERLWTASHQGEEEKGIPGEELKF